MAAILLIFLPRDCEKTKYHENEKKNTFPKANFYQIWLKLAHHQ